MVGQKEARRGKGHSADLGGSSAGGFPRGLSPDGASALESGSPVETWSYPIDCAEGKRDPGRDSHLDHAMKRLALENGTMPTIRGSAAPFYRIDLLVGEGRSSGGSVCLQALAT